MCDLFCSRLGQCPPSLPFVLPTALTFRRVCLVEFPTLDSSYCFLVADDEALRVGSGAVSGFPATALLAVIRACCALGRRGPAERVRVAFPRRARRPRPRARRGKCLVHVGNVIPS